MATNEIYNKHFKNASDSTIVEVDLNKNENLKDCNFKKFCTDYTCKTNTIKAKEYAEALALSFYVYLWKSICVGEFISVEDYAKKLKIVYDIFDNILWKGILDTSLSRSDKSL